MKKALFASIFILSTLTFSNQLEDNIEKNLMKNFPVLTDGITSIPVSEYDLDIEDGYTKLEIELKHRDSELLFSRLDKSKLETNVKKIVDQVKKESKNTNPIHLEIELDDNQGSDKTLYKNKL